MNALNLIDMFHKIHEKEEVTGRDTRQSHPPYRSRGETMALEKAIETRRAASSLYAYEEGVDPKFLGDRHRPDSNTRPNASDLVFCSWTEDKCNYGHEAPRARKAFRREVKLALKKGEEPPIRWAVGYTG